MFIIFDDMISDMLSNEKRNPIVTELFIRGINLKISLLFITKSYFAVSKILDETLHTILLWKSQTNDFQQIGFKGFMNLFKKGTTKPYSF